MANKRICIDCGKPILNAERCRECYRIYTKSEKAHWNYIKEANRNKNGKILYKHICDNCSKEFLSVKKVKVKVYNHFCSKECRSTYFKNNWVGENSPNWKDHYTYFKEKLRRLTPYIIWRKAVYERDKYTCQNCGERGGKIEAHHVKEFITMLREFNITTFEEAFTCAELWDIANGKTLCKKCHKEVSFGWTKTERRVV